jgi:chromosome segregation ATPase
LAPGLIVLLLFTVFVNKYLQQVEGEKRTMQLRLDTLRAEADASAAALARRQEEIKTLRLDRERIGNELKTKHEALSLLESKRLMLLAMRSKDAKERRSIEEQLATVNTAIHLATVERGKLEADLGASSRRVRFLEEQIGQLKTDRDNTTRKLLEVHTLLDKATLAQQDLVGQISSLESQIRDMNKKTSELQSRYENCNATLTQSQADLDATRSEMRSCTVQLEQRPDTSTVPTSVPKATRL